MADIIEGNKNILFHPIIKQSYDRKSWQNEIVVTLQSYHQKPQKSTPFLRTLLHSFLDVVAEQAPDFQYFHKLKCRINHKKFCQAFQVPQLESTKHHYSPFITMVIKKQNADNSGYNKRISIRGMIETLSEKKTQHFVDTYLSSVDNNQPTINGSLTSISNINITKIGNSDDLANFVISRDISDNFYHYYEASKHQTNFYRNQNREQVLRRHDNSFFFSKNSQSLKVSFNLQMYKEGNKSKKPTHNLLKYI